MPMKMGLRNFFFLQSSAMLQIYIEGTPGISEQSKKPQMFTKTGENNNRIALGHSASLMAADGLFTGPH